MNNQSVKAPKEKTAPTQAETVISGVMDYIMERNLRPGDRLPSERELAEMFHVSRPAVREASRALSVMNIVEIRQQSGMYIAPLEKRSPFDHFKIYMQAGQFDAGQLYELRMFLEAECAALAAEHITEEQLEFIRNVLQNAPAENEDAFADADSAIHGTIYEATCNVPLRLIMETISGWSVASRRYTNSFIEVRKIVHYDHLTIYDALKAHDPERSRNSMRQHIEHLHKIDDISLNTLRESYSKLLSSSTWDIRLDEAL